MGNNTVLTPVVDKNGKQTHVWKNAVTLAKDRVPGGPPPVKHSPTDEAFFEKMRMKHDMVVFNGKEWALGPEGMSGAYCFQCDGYFSKELIHTSGIAAFECSHCGAGALEGLTGVAIAYDSQKFLDEETTLTSTWFHSTVNPNWDTELQAYQGEDTPMVHLGTMEAATVRMNDLQLENSHSSETPLKFYIYEVKLLPTMSLSSALADDNNELAPETVADWRRDQFEEYDLFGATRYVNMYEAAGSISLLANPHHFEVVNRVEV
jgi:hypothetical protein